MCVCVGLRSLEVPGGAVCRPHSGGGGWEAMQRCAEVLGSRGGSESGGREQWRGAVWGSVLDLRHLFFCSLGTGNRWPKPCRPVK